ncbi:hypothetical protein [Streptomyces sp. NPDC088762]|uniref:hypothetical protein n=1 Tax=Streptomyces sp. NPDC088762 TaxID=3365891 RepID=UPI003822459F
MDPENASPRSLGSRLKEHVGWWLGTLGAIAGIIGLYFAFRPPPDPPIDMADWRVKASSACERQAGPVVTKWADARRAIAKLLEDDKAGLPADPQAIADAGGKFEDAGNAMRLYIGTLRDIEQPPAQAKQINEALDIGGEIGSALGIAGRAITERTPEVAKPELVYIDEHEAEFVEKMTALGAPGCTPNASVSGGSAEPTP